MPVSFVLTVHFSFWILEIKTGRTSLEIWTDTVLLHCCSHPPLIHPPLQPAASNSSQHDACVPTLAVPLTTTLDYHHGEKTQKEINLAAQDIFIMDSFLELWTWNALPQPLTLIQVSAAYFTPETSQSLLKIKGSGQTVGFCYFTTQNAPSSRVGVHAFGAAGRLPACCGDGACSRDKICLWSCTWLWAPLLWF